MRPAILALLLTGCALTPAHYEWYVDPNQGPMDYYRWKVVDRDDMIYQCHQEPLKERELACVFRLNQGVILPTDKPLNGKPVIPGEGKLCVILSTHSEDEAKRLPAYDYDGSHYDHELKHCNGILHNWIPGRIG